MPIILILFLVLVCSPIQWPKPVIWPSAAAAGLLTLAVMGGMVAHSFRVAQKTLRRIQGSSFHSAAIVDFHNFKARQIIWLAIGYIACLSICGWGWAVTHWLSIDDKETLAPGAEFVLLSPFLIAWVASWWACHWVERALSVAHGQKPLSASAYFLMQFRRQLALACIPIALIILEQSAARMWPDLAQQWYFQVASIGLVLFVLFAAPWLLRILLGLTPMPKGPLRDRLEAAARRMHFRYGDILVWNTHGQVANAMIAGILPWPRYVLFTDLLLAEMSPAEIEAVLGHEIGHIRHGHLPFYFAFLAMSLLVLNGLSSWTGDRWYPFPFLLATGAYIIIMFGFVSRRCEREADLFGCKTVSCGRPDCQGHAEPLRDEADLCRTGIDTFIGSLERVAVANGISRSRPGWLSSWQHSTIARRVEFLEKVGQQPAIANRFWLKMRVMKWAALAILAAAVSFLIANERISNVIN